MMMMVALQYTFSIIHTSDFWVHKRVYISRIQQQTMWSVVCVFPFHIRWGAFIHNSISVHSWLAVCSIAVLIVVGWWWWWWRWCWWCLLMIPFRFASRTHSRYLASLTRVEHRIGRVLFVGQKDWIKIVNCYNNNTQLLSATTTIEGGRQ